MLETPPCPRVRVLGCPVDVIDMDHAVDHIDAVVAAHRADPAGIAPCVVITLNPEMVMHARRDPRFRRLVESAGMLIPDGIGIVHALRRRGHVDAERVTGADLMDEVCARAARHGYRIALTGGAPGVAERAAERYAARFPGVQIVHAGSGDPTLFTVERLRAARPDIVGAAYGHGRQEAFLAEHLATIGAAVGIGIGGTLDYAAGAIRRAPVAVRRANLEWAWRLARQPSRIRRQAVLPAFWIAERREAVN